MLKELVLDGYTLNNNSIAILEYIKNYSTNFYDENENIKIKESIRKGYYSPISYRHHGYVFIHKNNVKQTIIDELKKLVKLEIIVLVDNILEINCCINKKYLNIIYNTDFSMIKPGFTKKINQKIIDKLITLSYLFEKDNKLDSRDTKKQFSSYQSFIKDYLIPLDFVNVVNYYDKTEKFSSIYRSNREVDKDLYKSQFNSYITLNLNLFHYLERNSISFPFYLDIDKKSEERLENNNKKMFEIFKKFNFKYFFKSNIKNEIKIFIDANIVSHMEFLDLHKTDIKEILDFDITFL